MKSSFAKGVNWRVTRLSGISPFCLSVALLVIAVPVPSHAACPPMSMAAMSQYYRGYCTYRSGAQAALSGDEAHQYFWRKVTKMGDQTVDPPGLGIWNSGTEGAGIISEALSYAMILAALYDDKVTFDRLSATVQAGIAYNQSKGNPGLFPWFWTPNAITTEYSPAVTSSVNGFDSASDADINIALAYIYADMATSKTVYGWSDPTQSYKMMAIDYIKAIRGAVKSTNGYYGDFSTTDKNTANNYVLADGYTQAKETFSNPNNPNNPNNWHPDYSDIRAYQLFKTYDNNAFWDTAISTTKVSWKAIFNFGTSDTRKTENANTGPIDPANSWVKLSNATYQNLQAIFMANPQSSPPDYSKVTAVRGGMDPQLYTADCQRLPIRLLNYINATKNSGDTDMFGIANANLTALVTSYTGALGTSYSGLQTPSVAFRFLVDKVNIKSPWKQPYSNFIQNFNAAGLFAYANNDKLPYDPATRDAVVNNLFAKFGHGTGDGSNGTINMELTKPDGFNSSLTLWGLTVSKNDKLLIQTPLQKYILSQ
jgi:glycosyl hydrolase family 8